MGLVIGIDVGGSTTKIVGFDEQGALIAPMLVRAADPTASVYGAFGKFTQHNALQLDDIDRVMITGVGSSCINDTIYGLPCIHVQEFQSVGLGGQYLTGIADAIIVSMGTGTALTHVYRNDAGKTHVDYLGGTGVGGGTVVGLSRLMLGMNTFEHVAELAQTGDLDRIDLQIRDFSGSDISLPKEMTASNFGKVSDVATREDIALGILNMVYETVGMMSIFNARSYHIRDIVLTGTLTNQPLCREIFTSLNTMFDVHFLIPKHSQFATVIGAALSSPVIPETTEAAAL